MANWEEITEEFDVQGTSGAMYVLQKMQTFVGIQTTTGTGRGRGSVRYKLSSGEHVNKLSDREFEILWPDREDNETVKRVD